MAEVVFKPTRPSESGISRTIQVHDRRRTGLLDLSASSRYTTGNVIDSRYGDYLNS
jgi:hypothetical protein